MSQSTPGASAPGRPGTLPVVLLLTIAVVLAILPALRGASDTGSGSAGEFLETEEVYLSP